MSRLTVTFTRCVCFCSTLLGGKITAEKLQTERHISEDTKCKLPCSMTVNLNNEKHFYYKKEYQHENVNM